MSKLSIRVSAPLNSDLPAEFVYQVYERAFLLDGWLIGVRNGECQNIAQIEHDRGTTYYLVPVNDKQRRYQQVEITIV